MDPPLIGLQNPHPKWIFSGLSDTSGPDLATCFDPRRSDLGIMRAVCDGQRPSMDDHAETDLDLIIQEARLPREWRGHGLHDMNRATTCEQRVVGKAERKERSAGRRTYRAHTM